MRRAALLLALVAAPAAAAGDVRDAVVARLDLTSFPNSVGPRRVAGRHGFADYGFTQVRRTADGADLYAADRGWMMGFRILAATPTRLRLCFVDRGLRRPQDMRGPSYDTRTALVVTRTRNGPWPAHVVPGGMPGCADAPAAR